ncbi:hypothetical protein RFI_09302 [Reticulomyxa filosa]|uniref:Uncharacterized protein n=1 Tax=Reticulomyxa filosa TaxID=46433 RepID=X6NNG8_RETFI|nr:hypothetical protein RFI_09302 [Reticulomyxa filosa]|eukprot:ETO27830.1 hypothetical protein RFI_09302 [Reticulomyxa filosa]
MWIIFVLFQIKIKKIENKNTKLFFFLWARHKKKKKTAFIVTDLLILKFFIFCYGSNYFLSLAAFIWKLNSLLFCFLIGRKTKDSAQFNKSWRKKKKTIFLLTVVNINKK